MKINFGMLWLMIMFIVGISMTSFIFGIATGSRLTKKIQVIDKAYIITNPGDRKK